MRAGGIDPPPKTRRAPLRFSRFHVAPAGRPGVTNARYADMSSKAPDPARLEKLLHKFDRAACDHPNIDAVVVFRPDLRSEETERHARNLYVKPADPESENYSQELAEE